MQQVGAVLSAARDVKEKKHNFIQGAVMAIPIVVGYAAIGIPFGILASKVGIPIWGVLLMSFFVFAGSAQFVAIQLLGIGSGVLPIVLATFILNLRHFLMGMSLGEASSRINPPLLPYLAQTITDETYGVNITKASSGRKIDPVNMLGTNIVSHSAWILATLMGVWIGNLIPVKTECAAAALPIMFAVLLGLQFRKLIHFVFAASSVVLTLMFMQIIPGNWPFLVTALVIPTVATVYEVIRSD